MESWEREMESTIEPLAAKYFKKEKNAEIKDRILSEIERYFPMAAGDYKFKIYRQGIEGILKQSESTWMHSVYRHEAERQLSYFTYDKRKHSFTRYFLRQYRYKQKSNATDLVAFEYISSDRNSTYKMKLWSMIYELFDDIKWFDGIGQFHACHIRGYQDVEEWMREVYSDTILYCMERFDPSKKSSFSGYTVDTFKFKLKDAIKIIVRRQQIEQTTDDIEKYIRGKKNSSAKAPETYHEETEPELSQDVLNGYLLHITVLIIQLYQKRSENRKSSRVYDKAEKGPCAKEVTKAEYFRILYTENVIHIFKMNIKSECDPGNLRYEREVFIALKTDMLDYLMRDICRTYKELYQSPLKKNEDILHDGDKKFIKLPIQEAIYTRYFIDVLQIERSQKSIAASISKYRRAFQKELELLQGS